MSKYYPRGADGSNQPVMVSARQDLELVKEAIEELKVLDEKVASEDGCFIFCGARFLLP